MVSDGVTGIGGFPGLTDRRVTSAQVDGPRRAAAHAPSSSARRVRVIARVTRHHVGARVALKSEPLDRVVPNACVATISAVRSREARAVLRIRPAILADAVASPIHEVVTRGIPCVSFHALIATARVPPKELVVGV